MLKNNLSLSPFIGDNKPLSIGLNPLGIRTASEQLFTALLPGLNVVTLRIRYYSFYCWLLKSFYEDRAEAKSSELRRHIRLSELLMALISAQSNNSGGVPGINRALEIIRREKEIIDFNEDAMPNGKPTGGYWKGSYGAFGTYYAASLQEIGIIKPLIDSPDLYNNTPKSKEFISGTDLADAFSESVGKETGRLFLECSNKGIVTRKQLKELEKTFYCHLLPDNNERKLLLELLLQNDKPLFSIKNSHNRRDSLRLLLSFLKERNVEDFSELEFAKYVYNKYNKDIEKSQAATGWYAYYLNDSRQYETLIIFDVILTRLLKSSKPGRWENIDEFASQLAKEVVDFFGVKTKTVKELLDNWNSVVEPKDQLAHAFYIIFDDYKKNPSYQKSKKIIRAFFQGVSNDALDSFDQFERHQNDTIFQYIKHYLIENVIYNHYSEAMRKYSQNGIPTQKLTIENGFVRGLSNYGPSHSSPRIGSLRNYAEDLGLISHNNKLTLKGVELLKKLQND